MLLLEAPEDSEVILGKFPTHVEVLVHRLVVVLVELPDHFQDEIGEAAQECLPGGCSLVAFGQESFKDDLVAHATFWRVWMRKEPMILRER